MGDVSEQLGSDLCCNLGEGRIIDGAWITAGAGDDDLGLVFECEFADLIEFDQAGGWIHAVVMGREDLSRMAHRVTVTQVTTCAQGHAQDACAGFRQGLQGGEICGGARVWLDVGVFGAFEQIQSAGDRQILDLVGDFAAAVIASPGIALGILVGDGARTCLADGSGAVIL